MFAILSLGHMIFRKFLVGSKCNYAEDILMSEHYSCWNNQNLLVIDEDRF